LTLGAVTAVIFEAERINTVTVCGITVGFFVVIGVTEILTVVIVTVVIVTMIIVTMIIVAVFVAIIVITVGNRADSRRTTGHEAITH
jgi:hypothetical protein